VDGGKGSNQAIAAARLGAKAGFVGYVGKDRIGDEGERWMREAGVDTKWLLRSQTLSSGVGFIILDEHGVPAMVTSLGANIELCEEDVEQALDDWKSAKVMLTQFEIKPRVALYAARKARQLGMLAIVNPAPASQEYLDGLEAASILVPNDKEAKVLLGIDPDTKIDLNAIANQLRHQASVETVIITAGEIGIIGVNNSGSWRAFPPSVQVADTSGAGDVYCAALAVGLVNGLSVEEASIKACAIAALSVTKAGTIPSFPTEAEVKAFLYKS
jgi:ribokinase